MAGDNNTNEVAEFDEEMSWLARSGTGGTGSMIRFLPGAWLNSTQLLLWV